MLRVAKFLSFKQFNELMEEFEGCAVLVEVFGSQFGRFHQELPNGIIIEMTQEECAHLEKHLQELEDDQRIWEQCAREGPIIPGGGVGDA